MDISRADSEVARVSDVARRHPRWVIKIRNLSAERDTEGVSGQLPIRSCFVND